MICTLIILAVFCFSTLGSAQGFLKKFSLKASGGIGTMAIGDTNDLFESNMEYFEFIADWYELIGGSGSVTGDTPKLNGGFDMFAEFIAFLTEKFGVSLGVGIINRTEKGDVNLNLSTPDWGDENVNWKAEPKITAVPVLLSLYYFHPIAEKLNVFINAGVGLYFCTQSWEGSNTYTGLGETDVTTDVADISGTAFGFHGGLGFEYAVNDSITLFVEGKGRSATIKSLKGDRTVSWDGDSDTESGTIWYTEEPADTTLTLLGYEFGDTKPDDSWYTLVRKWEVALSGVSAVVGIRISFGEKN